MLKIAQCTDTFLPIVDGVGRVVFNYADLLSKMDNEVYVLTPRDDVGYLGNYSFEIVGYSGMSVPGSPQYRFGMPNLDSRYHSRLNALKFDIIHAHSPGPSGLEAVRIAKKLDIPLVGTFHSKYYDDFYRVTESENLATLGAWYVSEFYNLCDEVWTVSNDAAETLVSYGYTGKVQIVQNGTELKQVDHAAAERARAEFELGEKPVLLYVGQIDFKKNLKLTLAACAKLKKNGFDFKLVMAGQGQDEKAVRALADELGLGDTLVMTGHLSEPELLSGLYACASLFVFPSLYDTAGLVVREAAVMETPSIVIAGSAPAEVIEDGENGFLCLNTPESLYDNMCSALANPAALKEAGVRARKTIPISWDDILKDVLFRYEGLIAQYPKSAGKKRRSTHKLKAPKHDGEK